MRVVWIIICIYLFMARLQLEKSVFEDLDLSESDAQGEDLVEVAVDVDRYCLKFNFWVF